MLHPSIIRDKKFWSLAPEAVADLLQSDREQGLTAEEAAARLSVFGRNAIRSGERAGRLAILLRQLASPLILVLIVAAGVTLLVAHYRDAVFIFVAVVVNAVLGFYQENKAERALAELSTYLRERARVVRGGEEREIDAAELVPGDLVRLAQGDRVPADARVLFVNDFQVDEAVLTGESLPVGKKAEPVPESATLADQDSMVFAGTLVTEGVGTALVVATDASTELGKIASLIARGENERTPLQAAIARFSVRASLALAALTLVVFAIGVLAGYSTLEMFLTAVAIAVSAIPEGLPVALTVILAVGVERMAKKKGVVRKLSAAEALGSTTVILTDKTGTLTMAKMALASIVPFAASEETLLARAVTNTHVLIENPQDAPEAWRMHGKIMEVALVRAAALRGMTLKAIKRKEHVQASQPFNAVQKFSGSLVREGGTSLVILVGAPDVLLAHAALSPAEKVAVLATIEERASSGERVLGLASKAISDPSRFSFTEHAPFAGLSFDGLFTFRDPIRPGVRGAIARVGAAGVKTVIMTGDHRGTAVSVARELGLAAEGRAVLDAAELATLSDPALAARLPHVSVVARVTPFDKLRITKLYQAAGETVAMTGDGVNDAPAIKQADVGVAMGSGTEVAQGAADLVLLDDNFETIVAAIGEGREILANIRKVLVYLLSNVADGLILIGGSLLFGLPLPLTALQILWVNFFTDSFPAVAFAFEKEPDSLAHPPRRLSEGLFDSLMRFLILVIGLSTSALLFVLYAGLLALDFDEGIVRTFTFAAFGTYTLLVALSVRSLDRSIFSYPLFSNRYLTAGIAIGLLLMAAAIYLPFLQAVFGTTALPAAWALGVILVGVLNIALIEAAKRLFGKKKPSASRRAPARARGSYRRRGNR